MEDTSKNGYEWRIHFIPWLIISFPTIKLILRYKKSLHFWCHSRQKHIQHSAVAPSCHSQVFCRRLWSDDLGWNPLLRRPLASFWQDEFPIGHGEFMWISLDHSPLLEVLDPNKTLDLTCFVLRKWMSCNTLLYVIHDEPLKGELMGWWVSLRIPQDERHFVLSLSAFTFGRNQGSSNHFFFLLWNGMTTTEQLSWKSFDRWTWWCMCVCLCVHVCLASDQHQHEVWLATIDGVLMALTSEFTARWSSTQPSLGYALVRFVVNVGLWNFPVGLWNFPVGLWNFPVGLWNLDCETFRADCETGIVKLKNRIVLKIGLWNSKVGLWNSEEGLWNWDCATLKADCETLQTDCETLGTDCETEIVKLCRRIVKLWGRIVNLCRRIVKLWGRIVKLGLCNSEGGLWNSAHGLWN